eukprot:m.212746 g.212746  ORF g.212746 m.212746 type:complete len:1242 (+) comp21352_c0_seq1:96-3821(+)
MKGSAAVGLLLLLGVLCIAPVVVGDLNFGGGCSCIKNGAPTMLCVGALVTFSQPLFNDCPQLTTLSLVSCSISLLPTNVFYNMTLLTNLVLRNNNINTITRAHLPNTLKLTNLDLSLNPISLWQTDLLDDLTMLQTISVGHASIPSLSSNIFVRQGVLNYMNSSAGTLIQCGSSTYTGSFITGVNIRACPVTMVGNVSAANFCTCQAGTTILDCSAKNLASEQLALTLYNCVSLQTIKLNNNFLTTLPYNTLRDHSLLTELHLQSNFLTIIPANSLIGLTKLSILLLSRNSLTGGSFPNPFVDLTSLTQLDLGKNSIGSDLSPSVFANLVSLNTLTLVNNVMTYPQPGLIQSLVNLTTLFLDNQGLYSLPVPFFQNSTKLTHLYMASVGTFTIPDGLFSASLSKLTFLSFQFTVLANFSQTSFVNLTSLTYLSLSQSDLTVVSRTMFSTLAQLQTLDLSYNAPAVWPTDIFDSMPLLQTVTVGHPSVVTITANLFRRLPALTTVFTVDTTVIQCGRGNLTGTITAATVKACPVTMVGNGTVNVCWCDSTTTASMDCSYRGLINEQLVPQIYNCSNMEEIRLQNNYLTIVPPTMFVNLTRLYRLFLTNNYITLIPAGSLSGLKNLTYLSLSNNKLTGGGISNTLSGLTSLYNLDLSKNFIGSDLPGTTFSNNGILDTLSLSQNSFTVPHADLIKSLGNLTNLMMDSIPSMTSLPATFFASSSKLTSLTLTGCGAFQFILPSGVFPAALSQLTYLSFYQTNLGAIDGQVFANLTALTALVLDGCNIPSFPAATFATQTALTYLRLSYNNLNESPLPSTIFLALNNLTTLEMNYFHLTSLVSGTFSSQSQLLSLSLYGSNLLASIPEDIFANLTSLNYLNLESCSLTSLEKNTFVSLTQLLQLRMPYNQLSGLHEDIFATLSRVQTLQIFSNPITTPFSPRLFFNMINLVSLTMDRINNFPVITYDANMLKYNVNLTTLIASDRFLCAFTSTYFDCGRGCKISDILACPLSTCNSVDPSTVTLDSSCSTNTFGQRCLGNCSLDFSLVPLECFNNTWHMIFNATCQAPICFGRNTKLQLADGSVHTVERLYGMQRDGHPLGSVLDVRGRAHPIRRVMADHSRDFSVLIPSGALGQGLPTEPLTLTASHLMQLPNGTVVSAGQVAAALGLELLVPRPGRIVFHIRLDDWVFLAAHGVGAESAASTAQHMAARSAAHARGHVPDPDCQGDNNIGDIEDIDFAAAEQP